ncbi:MAG: hypothetical protein A3J70_08880 [Elusimicrobia bacterium RIFCSPHIGHO2_02_FULL_61_10]|nr:MAG: hypothetical protein A3I76_04290 [Elusimicrobia bacterium RIFCSPLOWO2_02_FULL_61_11]OGS19129.1 MAG: hypothetical protein A3J70_08880 [Elusimicrobia bacterium RIFCSPHIGHO2_02_FULL_61_10]
MQNSGFTNSADKLVLIVDDDKEIIDLLEAVVKKEGFKVEKAEDGLEAQNKARSLLPDLILLDLMLPKAGGFEILQSLQADETSDIPVVVLTGRRLDRTTSDMIRQQSNVRDFMEKPVKAELLTSAMHQILRTRPMKKP